MKFLFQSFILVLVFSACGGSNSTTTSDKKIFKYNQSKNIESLDPAFAKAQNTIWATHHLYNGLVELNEQLEIKPAIAHSWEASEDGKTLTFYLRNDVYFHDHQLFEGGKGTQVTAQDFVYSLSRIIDDKVASPGSWIFKDRLVEENPFTAPNDSTFVIQLKAPFLPIMGILAMQYCSVVPQKIVEHFGEDFRKNPVGTGPFKYKNWVEGQALFLEKNPNYFEKGLPKLDGVKISFIGDRKTEFLEFKKGNLDFLSGIESSFADELLTKEGTLQEEIAQDVNSIQMPFLNMEYLGFYMNNKENSLSNKYLRQAMNYAIDKELMLKQLRNSVGKAAHSGFTPKGLPSFDANIKGYSHDVEKAKQLLAEAGYPKGEGLSEIVLKTNKDYSDLCKNLVEQWKDIGINVKMEIEESGTLREMIKQGKVSFFRASWFADYPEAENFMACFYSKNPAPPNYTQFKNEQFDELYEQSLLEADDTKRYDLYHQMETILIEEAPVIFLFYDETSMFSRKNISGISKNAIKLLDLKRVDKE